MLFCNAFFGFYLQYDLIINNKVSKKTVRKCDAFVLYFIFFFPGKRNFSFSEFKFYSVFVHYFQKTFTKDVMYFKSDSNNNTRLTAEMILVISKIWHVYFLTKEKTNPYNSNRIYTPYFLCIQCDQWQTKPPPKRGRRPCSAASLGAWAPGWVTHSRGIPPCSRDEPTAPLLDRGVERLVEVGVQLLGRVRRRLAAGGDVGEEVVDRGVGLDCRPAGHGRRGDRRLRRGEERL